MDGQTERVNQILEDMLGVCVMEHQGRWDKNLPWAEFSHNNSYQESPKMAPFEVLYGPRCRTLLNWIEPGKKVIFGPDLIDEAETTVSRIQDKLKAAKSCQESYANKRRRPLEFEVGNHVYLKVSPVKGMKRFAMKGKLAPRYIGPFPILEKCGNVAYKLEFVTPSFKIKTRCSSYVFPRSSCHTYGQNVNIENQCLYYITFITWHIVFTRRLG
jgi:hypothetical protein